RRCVGMDRERVRRLPGVRGPSVPRVLRGVLRRGLSRPARRLVGHPDPRRLPHLPQLGPPAAPSDLRRPADREGRVRSTAQTPEIRIDSFLSDGDERNLAYDVLDGLTRPFKEIPPKHFYDARGSELFERICELPEYYPTRTEQSILTARAREIVGAIGAGELVELGSGAADKARILLDAMASAGTLDRYVP